MNEVMEACEENYVDEMVSATDDYLSVMPTNVIVNVDIMNKDDNKWSAV
jgi:hypothetical protein